MVCSVRSGFFVFTSEIEKLIKSNRVKDGVIVCEMGIRVQKTPVLYNKMSPVKSKTPPVKMQYMHKSKRNFILPITFRNTLRVCS